MINPHQSSYLKAPRYRIHLEYDVRLDSEAVEFVNYLKNAAERRDIKLRYVRGVCDERHIILLVPKEKGGNFDAFLQELILSNGLFYYSMTLNRQRNKTIHHVIEPIYKSILEDRFINTCWKHISDYIHGALSPRGFVPTDTANEFSKTYEVLYRKWTLGMADNSEFIREADALATKFLLHEVEHTQGSKSPQFNVLLALANKQGVGMDRDFRKVFEKMHRWRTASLHRLNEIDQEEVATAASRIFIYFQYFDEFSASQNETQELLHGQWYDRVKYGDEKWLESRTGRPYIWTNPDGSTYDFADIAAKRPCGDCGAVKGQYHCGGCDIERCPRCNRQLLSCGCRTDKDIQYYESSY